MIRKFITKDKNVPNFSTWVTVDGKKHEVRCTDGVVEVDNKKVADYLDRNSPFAQYEGHDTQNENYEKLKSDNIKLRKQVEALTKTNKDLIAELKPVENKDEEKEETKDEEKEETKKEKKAREKAEKKANKK